jgi:hypothetical protein
VRRANDSFFAPLDRFRGALLGGAAVALLLLHELVEFGAQLVEKADVVGVFLHHALDQLVQPIEEAGIAVGILGPADAGRRQRVEQPPGRVLALGEQALVLDRDAHVGNLQARQRSLDLGGKVAILHHELEQHADQIDGILVGLRHPLVGIVDAGGAQLPEQVLLDLLHPFDQGDGIGSSGRQAGLAQLHARQRGDQFRSC